MKFSDLTDIIEQNEGSMFIARDNDRQKRYEQMMNQKIQDYIKNGSKGDLILTRAPIKSLPDNLTVNGDLKISYCPNIEVLPKNLHVTGTLFADNCPNLTYIHDGLVVGRFIYLQRSSIETVPVSMKVGRSLILSESKLRYLPDNFEVIEDLKINHTPIEKLPDNLSVGLNLFISNCPNLKSIPPSLNVGMDFTCATSPVEDVPTNIHVGGDLTLIKTPFAQKMRKLRVKRLNIETGTKQYTQWYQFFNEMFPNVLGEIYI